MTHAVHLMGRLRGWTTPESAPHGPDGPTGPQPIPEGDPTPHTPPETLSAPYALDTCRACGASSPRCWADGGRCCNACHHPTTRELPPHDGPTDRPPPGMNARWVADEAGHLARLAQLTTTRSPWMAAVEMNRRNP